MHRSEGTRSGTPALPATLEKKLIRYTVVAGAALAASQTKLHADVVVVPYSPALNALASSNFLDVNDDGTYDFIFSGFCCEGFEAIGLDGCGFNGGSLYFFNNQVAVEAGCGCGCECGCGGATTNLDQLEIGDIVDSSLTYNSYGNDFSWSPAGDGYLGFSFQLADGTHYGYFTIDPNQIESVTYDSDPGVGVTIQSQSSSPEPGTLGMLALGAAAAGLIRRRRKVQ